MPKPAGAPPGAAILLCKPSLTNALYAVIIHLAVLQRLDPLAQLAEHLTFNQGVPRSSRGWITNRRGLHIVRDFLLRKSSLTHSTACPLAWIVAWLPPSAAMLCKNSHFRVAFGFAEVSAGHTLPFHAPAASKQALRRAVRGTKVRGYDEKASVRGFLLSVRRRLFPRKTSRFK